MALASLSQTSIRSRKTRGCEPLVLLQAMRCKILTEDKSSKGPTSTSIPICRTNEHPIYPACPLAGAALHLNRHGTRSESAPFLHPADG